MASIISGSKAASGKFFVRASRKRGLAALVAHDALALAVPGLWRVVLVVPIIPPDLIFGGHDDFPLHYQRDDPAATGRFLSPHEKSGRRGRNGGSAISF